MSETRELIETMKGQHPARECEFYDGCGACQRCPDSHPLDQDSTATRWCQPCRDRALLAECDAAARGEA